MIKNYKLMCNECDGTGKTHPFDFKDCSMCEGSGTVYENMEVCSECHSLESDCECYGEKKGPWSE